MEVHSFAEIEEEFIQRVHRLVWCNVATVDERGRPRSRILHPIWEGATGWIATGRSSYKSKQIDSNPFLSLAYVGDVFHPVFIECRAEWVDSPYEKRRIWQWFAAEPPPLGYDLAGFFDHVDHPGYGLLKLTPWRLELVDFVGTSFERRTWRPRLQPQPA